MSYAVTQTPIKAHLQVNMRRRGGKCGIGRTTETIILWAHEFWGRLLDWNEFSRSFSGTNSVCLQLQKLAFISRTVKVIVEIFMLFSFQLQAFHTSSRITGANTYLAQNYFVIRSKYFTSKRRHVRFNDFRFETLGKISMTNFWEDGRLQVMKKDVSILKEYLNHVVVSTSRGLCPCLLFYSAINDHSYMQYLWGFLRLNLLSLIAVALKCGA